MVKKEELIKIFALNIRNIIAELTIDFNKLQEIRLRAFKPLIMIYNNKEYFVTKDSSLTDHDGNAYMVTKNEIKETMEYVSNYSLYAYEEEIKQGFLTIQGGHRIGIAGKVILENNNVKNIKYISFINVRLSHEVKGCADDLLDHIYGEGGVRHTLIISPPRCGKTTLLRDIIRQISDGAKGNPGVSVGVVDERSEIAACYMGVPQNDLGVRTDILDCCPKAKGMLMMIRTMSPAVVAVDEIGMSGDIEAIKYVINCGCKLIATVHGSSIEDICTKPHLNKLIKDNIFECFIVLDNVGKIGNIKGIFNNKEGSLCF